jgi:hypothetical protein
MVSFDLAAILPALSLRSLHLASGRPMLLLRDERFPQMERPFVEAQRKRISHWTSCPRCCWKFACPQVPKSRPDSSARHASRADFIEPSFWRNQRAMTTSRPRKLLVYLDQNFISEMAKPAHRRVRPDFKELYAVLHKGFWNEQLVVLRSRFHDVETSLAGALKDAIKARRSTLGHVDLVSQWDIRESQIVASLHKFLGRGDGCPVICYDGIFEDEPDDSVGHFDINVDMDWMHADAKEQRERLAAQLDTVRQRIHKHSISYNQQFMIEMDAFRE